MLKLDFSVSDLSLPINSNKISRASISGVQDKVQLKRVRGRFIVVESGGDYILKPVPRNTYAQLPTDIPANEALTMDIAEKLFRVKVAEHQLVTHAAQILDLTLRAADAVGISLRAECGTAGEFEDGLIVVLRHDNGGAVTVAACHGDVLLIGSEACEGGYAHGAGTRRGHQRCERVSDVIVAGIVIAPMVGGVDVSFIELDVVYVNGMIVFALGVQELTQRSLAADPLHLQVEEHKGEVLAQHINGTAFLSGANQLDALGHRAVGHALGVDVETSAQTRDGIRRVLMEVVADDDGIHLMINEFVKFGVGRDTLAQFFQTLLQTVLVEIAERDDLRAR